MLNLIFLEDEAVLREELTEFLTDIGYNVDAVADLTTFRRTYDAQRHRIALLDLGLPDGDGMALIRELRSSDSPIGIVVFTARNATPDKIAGLVEGADYFLGKSADLDELAATIVALERRLGEVVSHSDWVLEVGPRRLLPPGHSAIALSQQDLVVLQTLMEQPGQTVSRRDIIKALGEDYLSYDQRRLDTQIRRLRRKTEEASGVVLPINTIRNGGYQFFATALIER